MGKGHGWGIFPKCKVGTWQLPPPKPLVLGMPSPRGFTQPLDIRGPCSRLVMTSEKKPRLWPIRLLEGEGWVVWSNSPLNWHLKMLPLSHIGLSIGAMNFVLPMRLLELVPPFCFWRVFCLDYWTKLNVTCLLHVAHANVWEAFSAGIWIFLTLTCFSSANISVYVFKLDLFIDEISPKIENRK